MGNRYDTVKPNKEAFTEDLERFGITAKDFSRKIGQSDNYVTSLFNKDKADRKVIEAIEDRMFREHGAYYTEIEKAEPVKEVSEGVGIILKQILTETGAMTSSIPKVGEEITKVIYRIDGVKAGNDRKMDELIKAVRESNAANEMLLRDILQKMKELTTLQAKTLSALERRANV